MTTDVYIVLPKLFIQLNLVHHGQKMIPISSAYYSFLSPLYNLYTIATAYLIDLVG
jgi:hypothetical protein